jgi:methyl-branched lipid omega-hydroxylase
MSAERESVDLSDVEFWMMPAAERSAAYETLRRKRPMPFFAEPVLATPVPLPAGPGYYAVACCRDVLEVSRHPEDYCSGKGAISVIDLPPEMLRFFSGIVSSDNPRHARLRRIVSDAFTPRRITSIEASIADVARETVARVRSAGTCDFVAEIAAPIPLAVICDMMGIPASERDTVLRCSNVILSREDPEYFKEGEQPLDALLNAGFELAGLMTELAAHRVAHPTDDLTSTLLHSEVDGESLTEDEVTSFFLELVSAGNETIRSALAHGMLALSEHPEERAEWQSNVEAVTPTAIDEVLRWSSPINWMRRTVTRDVVLAETKLHEGDKLLLLYGSANRDEDVFPDPDRFDVRRRPNAQVAFGAPGPHYCLGAHLARRELAVTFRELFSSLPDIEVSGPMVQMRSRFVNGIKQLPCEFTPAGSPSTSHERRGSP